MKETINHVAENIRLYVTTLAACGAFVVGIVAFIWTYFVSPAVADQIEAAQVPMMQDVDELKRNQTILMNDSKWIVKSLERIEKKLEEK